VRISSYLSIVVCTLAVLSLQSDGQHHEEESGFARIANVDPESKTLTLLTTDHGNRRVDIETVRAKLKGPSGENATVADFKKSQYVQYSWRKVGDNLEDIQLAQAFCKRQGPTICESQARKKECHHQCSDGPCACPK
jgi:hypothetical protein